MELLVIATLCIGLFVITNSASHQTQVQSAHELVQDLGLPTLDKLPRKLIPIEESTVKGYETKGFIPNTKKKGAGSGKLYRPSMTHGSGGTRQNWVERTDSWQFYTMDYTHVRRRRPIHNKAMPVGP